MVGAASPGLMVLNAIRSRLSKPVSSNLSIPALFEPRPALASLKAL